MFQFFTVFSTGKHSKPISFVMGATEWYLIPFSNTFRMVKYKDHGLVARTELATRSSEKQFDHDNVKSFQNFSESVF